jgi:hypothetical protein
MGAAINSTVSVEVDEFLPYFFETFQITSKPIKHEGAVEDFSSCRNIFAAIRFDFRFPSARRENV